VIEKSVLLRCDQERAFALFTEEISAWWPPSRRHTSDAESTLFLLPEGRFFERARDGHEVELGRVRLWEAPYRLLLDFYPGTDAAHPTEVEIRFEIEDAGTRVLVLHRATAASESLFGARALRYAASWGITLDSLRAAAERLVSR
jgi:hypothetical protein